MKRLIYFSDLHSKLYQGGTDKEKRNGFGIQLFLSKSVYLGNWAADQANGAGMMIYPDGSFVLGEFQNNILLSGSIKFRNLGEYKGTFDGSEDEHFQAGEFHFKNGMTLKGKWINGTFQSGVLLDSKSSVFEPINISFEHSASTESDKYSLNSSTFKLFGERGVLIENREKKLFEGAVHANRIAVEGTHYFGSKKYQTIKSCSNNRKSISTFNFDLSKGFSQRSWMGELSNVSHQTINLMNGLSLCFGSSMYYEITLPALGNDNYEELAKKKEFDLEGWEHKLDIGRGKYRYNNSKLQVQAIELDGISNPIRNKFLMEQRITLESVWLNTIKDNQSLIEDIRGFVRKRFPERVDLVDNLISQIWAQGLRQSGNDTSNGSLSSPQFQITNFRPSIRNAPVIKQICPSMNKNISHPQIKETLIAQKDFAVKQSNALKHNAPTTISDQSIDHCTLPSLTINKVTAKALNCLPETETEFLKRLNSQVKRETPSKQAVCDINATKGAIFSNQPHIESQSEGSLLRKFNFDHPSDMFEAKNTDRILKKMEKTSGDYSDKLPKDEKEIKTQQKAILPVENESQKPREEFSDQSSFLTEPESFGLADFEGRVSSVVSHPEIQPKDNSQLQIIQSFGPTINAQSNGLHNYFDLESNVSELKNTVAKSVLVDLSTTDRVGNSENTLHPIELTSKAKSTETDPIQELLFVGQKVGNKKQGLCSILYSDGSLFKGFYASDERSGFGQLCLANGQTFYGFYKEDKPVDRFLRKKMNGDLQMGVFREGKFVSKMKRIINNFEVDGELLEEGLFTGKGILVSNHFELVCDFIDEKININVKSLLKDVWNKVEYEGFLSLDKREEVGIFVSSERDVFQVNTAKKKIKCLNIKIN